MHIAKERFQRYASGAQGLPPGIHVNRENFDFLALEVTGVARLTKYSIVFKRDTHCQEIKIATNAFHIYCID